ncbi:MAG: hypothetical protein QOE16_1654 [Microbacteriaceae bacterium]|nr:hypothetical protein [Microbacteriaceae bacterium]
MLRIVEEERESVDAFDDDAPRDGRECRKPLIYQGFSLAVPVGFEPTVGFHPHNFSRVAPSAARTRYRGQLYASEADSRQFTRHRSTEITRMREAYSSHVMAA